ncbi:MAG: DUF1828 domain-containing protein, partial [Candidatus Hydrogenedentes bacterium]|nr:DUF1828 domain-containing protein [Candidatus Hydrogenedentota bacterium]
MSTDTIEQEFQQKVSKKVRLAAEGVDRYRVFTPFMFEDGDHLAVVLKREGEGWFLSDEGHTYMHVSYDLEARLLQEGTRNKLITAALSALSVEDRGGELVLAIPDNRYGDALFSFVQALLKISDVTFLSREHVRSTFMEDFRAFMEEKVPEGRREFDWHDPRHDPDAKYAVDCRVNGTRRPLFVYALLNDGKVKDATIRLLTFEKW